MVHRNRVHPVPSSQWVALVTTKSQSHAAFHTTHIAVYGQCPTMCHVIQCCCRLRPGFKCSNTIQRANVNVPIPNIQFVQRRIRTRNQLSNVYAAMYHEMTGRRYNQKCYNFHIVFSGAIFPGLLPARQPTTATATMRTTRTTSWWVKMMRKNANERNDFSVNLISHAPQSVWHNQSTFV